MNEVMQQFREGLITSYEALTKLVNATKNLTDRQIVASLVPFVAEIAEECYLIGNQQYWYVLRCVDCKTQHPMPAVLMTKEQARIINLHIARMYELHSSVAMMHEDKFEEFVVKS